VYDLDFSPDDEKVASASWDHRIYFSIINVGCIENKFLEHTDRIYAVKYSSDGSKMVSAGENEIKLWNGTDGEFIRKINCPG